MREPRRGVRLGVVQGRGGTCDLHPGDPPQTAGSAGQDHRTEGVRPTVRRKPAWLLGFVAMAELLVLPPVLRSFGIYLLSYWLVFVIATMGLNLTVGYAGQASLGHAAFLGIGAYSVAIVMKVGLSFWLGLPLGGVLCFVVGLGLGFPALRVQTIYLAFATRGFNVAMWLVMRNEKW